MYYTYHLNKILKFHKLYKLHKLIFNIIALQQMA